jgi:hypothetical protein
MELFFAGALGACEKRSWLFSTASLTESIGVQNNIFERALGVD